MPDFSAEDHDRLARLDDWRESVDLELAMLSRRQRRLPVMVARAVMKTASRRAAIVLGIGVLLGQALGAGAGELVRRAFSYLLGNH